MLVSRQAVLRRFWYALMPLSALDSGPKPFTLLGEKLVLWKRSDGTPAAVRDRCCHRTAQLSKGFVEGDNIVCGYHGWQYDCSGACVKIPQAPGMAIPAGARVQAFHCQEKYGYVWVALDDPLQPVFEIPEDADAAFRRVHQFDLAWKTGALRLMENSFDAAHFAFVHRGTFGQAEQPKPEFFEIRETDYGFEAETRLTINNPPASHRITGTREPTTQRHFRNQWHLPFNRRLGLVYPNGLQHVIFTCATPIDDEHIRILQWLYRNDSEADCPAAEINAWDLRVIEEDREILETVDADAPVDLTRRAEQNMAADQPGLIMRRRLKALIEAHGEREIHRGIHAAASAQAPPLA